MPSISTETRKFEGLFLQQNSFEVPDGAFETALNVQIQSDGLVSKVKGFYTYYTPPAGKYIDALFTFENKLIAIISGTVCSFDDDASDPFSPIGIRSNNAGTVTLDGDSRSAEENENLYFTTGAGAYKLESYSSKVRPVGVPPALDLAVSVGTLSVGPLPADSQSAYRCVFGRRDENGNLLLGSPSDIATIGIPNDGTGLAYVSSGGGPYVVTVTLPTNSGWYTGQQIIVTNGSDVDVNGVQTITVVPASSTDIRFTVASNPTPAGTLDISFSRTSDLTATIPSEIDDVTDNWFVQWYRSTSSLGLAVSPSPDFALIGEQNLTASDITLGVVEFEDDVDPLLVGAQLYTNPNSREGEQQRNQRPPMSSDISLFNTYMVYANVTTRQAISLQLIDPTIAVPYTFKLKFSVLEEGYVAVQTVGNVTTPATSVAGVTTVTITYNNHGASNGWTVYISNVTGSVPRGVYTVSGVTINTFNITSTGNTATALDFEFETNGVSGIFFLDTVSASTAQQVANTARNLVKAVNRTSVYWYANYTSTFDEIPGKMRFESKGFLTETMYVADNRVTSGSYFIPPIPNSFASGTQVYAENSSLPDAVYYSKSGEPEACPPVNFIRIGSKNKPIYRIFALRDCLIVLKADGAYVLTGETIPDFSVSTLDSTVLFSSARAASKINNTVIAISNQGLVQVTEKSVQIISRRVDDVIQPIVGFSTSLPFFLGFGYETQRTYFLSIPVSLLDRDTITYMYNVLNNTWTATDLTFEAMIVGPSDICYGATFSGIEGNIANAIQRQRKSQTLVDYSREFMTATAIASDLLTLTVVLTGGGTSFTPDEGDVVVYNEVINRINSIVDDGLGGFTVVLSNSTNIPTSGSPVDVILYQGFLSTIKMAPFHAGQVGRMKQFSEFQLHLRQNAISELNISFAGAYFGSSEDVDWASSSSATGSSGWGFEPWGLFAWGLADSIRLVAGTATAPIIRTWVPKFAQRTTFIQAILNHRQACEPLLLQALAYQARGYGPRTSK